MLSFLPKNISDALNKENVDSILEIRIRVNAPIYILKENGWKKLEYIGEYKPSLFDLEKMFLRLSDHSVYAHIDTLKQGYITTKNGIRVGIAGEVVKDGNDIKIIKEISSMCIRLPKEVIGCAQNLYQNVFRNGLKNLLIISPPGLGKTTFLRDIIRILANNYNVLCVDERLEISAKGKFFLGERVDVLSLATKEYGLNYGVKSMSPDVICVDELANIKDVNASINACFSGVNVIATVHGKSLEDIKNKAIFNNLITSGAFERYCTILKRGQVTEIGCLK